MVRAQDSSFAAVTFIAQAFSLASAVESAVARAAIDSATV